MSLTTLRRHCTALIAGVGLAVLTPQVLHAEEPEITAPIFEPNELYVQQDDRHLLYEGQISGDAGIDATPNTNLIEQELASAIERYRDEWTGLPTFNLERGSRLDRGDSGARVEALRARLGLADGDAFDDELRDRVALFRDMHGLSEGGHVDNDMIAALNRGPSHYLRILETNLFRASELPDYLGRRYVHVDTLTQTLSMVDEDETVDTMRVVVGRPETQTPMMAGLVRYAIVNPYWNVPPDLVRDRYARRVIDGGQAYLRRTGFQLLSDFSNSPEILSPSDVDWPSVLSGDVPLRMRQLPGAGNGMGSVKFMFPNGLGIYLHDTPSTDLFEQDERMFSAGCVRVSRPESLGRWLMDGPMPEASGDPEEIVELPFPVPIYITYFTARADGDRIEFREDIYSRDTEDAPTLAQLD